MSPEERDGNGTKVILDFVSRDNRDFSLSSFLEQWPADPEKQRLVLAALIARNTREVQEILKGQEKLWLISTATAIGAAAALSHALGADYLVAAVAGLVIGAVVQVVGKVI